MRSINLPALRKHTCRFQGEYAASQETFKTSLKEFGLGHHLEAGRLQILKVR